MAAITEVQIVDGKELVRHRVVGHTLAHERDSGAKCLKCGPKCEGLDLHFWRKICRNCNCKLEDHDVQSDDDMHKSIVDALLADRGITKLGKLDINDQPIEPLENHPTLGKDVKKNFVLAPQATPSAMEKFLNDMPREKAPHKSEEGKIYRNKQLAQQLPKHDFDHEHCDNLSQEEMDKMKAFNDDRNEKAIGQGDLQEKQPKVVKAWECHKCKGVLKGGEVAVFAERAGADKCWHPSCFTCKTCDEMLVDLIYFFKDGDIYCGRHHAELTRVRCAACDELIFTKEYTQAEDQNWHLKHFSCFNCDAILGGQKYVARENNPYCMACYDVKFAKVCACCQTKIQADGKRVSYKEAHWHANENCFKCVTCQKSMLGQQFIYKNNSVFCSPACAKK